MNIVQITPGAGGMYCGNCFRDNALVATLRQLGHSTLMVPLYLPLRLDEPDSSTGTPIFFSGVNVYLEQKSSFFRTSPHWLHELLASPRLLQWTSGFAAKTRPEDVGDMALSMLQGETGYQAREIEVLIRWLRTQPKPDVICLSNCLLIGLVRQLRAELDTAVVVMLQGEDSFLDALSADYRDKVWSTLVERAAEADYFVSPSHYFADKMSHRLHLPSERLRVVPNGINLTGYPEGAARPRVAASGPVVGYFARMCPDKGLDTLVEAFMLLKRRNRIPQLRLHIGGGCGPADEPFVNLLRDRLKAHGWLGDVTFAPNLDREAKIRFLHNLTVFSVPALYGEAFGLYVVEAMAAGVPVVQPRHAAFPELVADSGGGLCFEPSDPTALADALEALLQDEARAKALGEAGQQAVRERYSVNAMASQMVQAFEEAVRLRRLTGARRSPKMGF